MPKTKFRCDICNQDFKWEFLLDNHLNKKQCLRQHLMTKTHLIRANSEKVAKENDAKKNNFEEDLENDLQMDTYLEKPDLKKNYPCKICKEDFDTEPDLRQHLMTKTHLMVKADSGTIWTSVSPKKAMEAIKEDVENETSLAEIYRTECKFGAKKM